MDKSNLQLTSDWFSHNIDVWSKVFETLKGKPNLKFLEIGCFEGLSTVWMLREILTDASSRIYCIDTFEGSSAFPNDMTETERANAGKFLGLYDRFAHNIQPYADKVTTLKGYSSQMLKTQIILNNRYDFIYVDASHRSRHVLEDAVLAFPLLKINGVMIFDDYLMSDINSLENPKIGIDCFMRCYERCYRVVYANYQLIIQKTCES